MPSNKRYRDIYLVVLFLLFCFITYGNIRTISSKSYYMPQSDFDTYLDFSKNTVYYPPGILLIVNCFQNTTGVSVNHFVYKSVMLLLWFCTACFLCRYVFGKGWLFLAALGLMTIHPYFIWTCLMSTDTASECFFLFLSFLVLLRLYEHFPVTVPGKIIAFLLSLVVLAAAAIMRSTNFVIILLLLCFFFLKSRKEIKYYIAVMLIAFTAYTAGFCFYNYQRKGAFTLSTTFGFNMLVGNCKAYLHGHPKYDIDLFFTRQWMTKYDEPLKHLTEAQQNRYYMREGIAEIRRDIPSFVYRCIVKSLWHWFNIEKIPNFAAPDTYLSKDGSTITVGNIVIIPALAYVIYKLFYVPLFIASLCLLLLKKLPFRFALFFVPYLALWPLVVAMFPDTRFKICAEIMAIIPMLYSLQYLYKNRACLLNNVSSPETE